jgi:hypothetical protein
MNHIPYTVSSYFDRIFPYMTSKITSKIDWELQDRAYIPIIMHDYSQWVSFGEY